MLNLMIRTIPMTHCQAIKEYNFQIMSSPHFLYHFPQNVAYPQQLVSLSVLVINCFALKSRESPTYCEHNVCTSSGIIFCWKLFRMYPQIRYSTHCSLDKTGEEYAFDLRGFSSAIKKSIRSLSDSLRSRDTECECVSDEISIVSLSCC